MLLNCPECELQVSDKAKVCPHCGYPMQEEGKISRPRKSNKRKRLPNGFGQISEIKGQNLRNPFRAMVTIGKDKNGRPICKPLKPKAYFATYNEAYTALVDYHRRPLDMGEDITMDELYNRWFEKYSSKLKSNSAARMMELAWSYCSSIHNMNARDVRIPHLKNCMENGTRVINGEVRTPTKNIAAKIKTMFNHMFDYGIEYEYVDKNYARMFDAEARDPALNGHIPYTDEEIDKMWTSVDKIEYVDLLLIQCYSGWRPNEICEMKRENVNLKEKYFIGGSKTDAGIDRKVPIHSKIYPLVEKYYNRSSSFGAENVFVRSDGSKITYNLFRIALSRIVRDLKLNIEHRPHDGRTHFITQAKKYNVNEYVIKHLVGHAISDLTERVYTHRDLEWLSNEIEKIK